MSGRGLVKCSSLFFIIFLMCPRRIRLTAPKQQDYFHALKRSTKDVFDADVFGSDHSSNILRQNVYEKLLIYDYEPGFDLSDNEIRKFKLWPKGIIPYYIDVVSFNASEDGDIIDPVFESFSQNIRVNTATFIRIKTITNTETSCLCVFAIYHEYSEKDHCFDKVLRDRIRTFLNAVQRQTKLSFLEMPTPPKDDKTRWVFFVNRRGQLGCSDHSILNFTNEGVQHVNLGYDCIWTGGELAEAVLSIVGVPPQHNSPDRDLYIKVMDENIIPEKRYLFNKLTDDRWLFHEVKYDFASAGHFHHHKHSATGRATIEFRDPNNITFLEENVGFTLSDLKKLRMLYNYIVMKKENKVPECDKLFRKSENFYQHPRLAIDFMEPKPRKKPNKYLGLPEDHHEKEQLSHEYHEDKDHDDKGHEDGKHEKDTKEGGDSKSEEYTGSKDRSDETSSDRHNLETKPLATRKMDLKSHPAKGKHKTYKIDLLSYLSDYQTGDEHRRKSVHNKTLKGNK